LILLIFKNAIFIKRKKEEKLNDDFDEIYQRLTAGCYVFSSQIKRYLKSIIKDKKG